MNFAPSPAICEEAIPQNLKLPEGQIIPSDDDKVEYILFTIEEYRKIVHIYNGYVLYDNNREYVLRLKLLDFKLDEIKDKRLELCLETKDDLKTEIDDVFNIWAEEHKLRLKENNKSKVSGVFVGLGAGIGGLILGAAVGIIWASTAK